MKTPLDIIEETYVELALNKKECIPIRNGISAMVKELSKPGKSAIVRTDATIFITHALALLLALPIEEHRQILLDKITEMALKEAKNLNYGLDIASRMIESGQEDLCSSLIKAVMS